MSKTQSKTQSKTRNTKINHGKVLELRNKGLSCTDIAKQQGVVTSTITRYLDSISPQIQALKRYSNAKADTLNLSQLKLQSVSNLIVDNLLSDPENNLLKQDLRLQKEILIAVHGAKTYDFNSQRVQEGKSTDNIALVLDSVQQIRAMQASKTV
jgi:IS30 family transposase